MNNVLSAFLLSSVATLVVAGAAAAQTAQPKPQYTAEELVKAFSAPAAEQAPAADAADGECAAKGMVAGDDGVCEPAKDSRGFSLPTATKGDTRGFTLPTRAAPKGDTRGFSVPTTKAQAQPAKKATPPAKNATANANASNRNRAGGSRMASAPRSTAPASASVRRDLFISFEPGSTQLTQQAQANARAFAEALAAPQLANARFEIQGHTDANGSREQNLLLSQRRAEAVRAYLVSLGVDADRLQAKGYGFEQLAAPSNPRAPENRRVEANRLN
jgi:outer membrane protein OmpA-like peptidoglycan-associated protein